MSLQLLSIGQLVACVAYLALAYAFFLLAERLGSGNAKVAAIAFAYCGVGLFAQIVATFGQYISVSPGLSSITSSYLFNLLVGGLRPYALLLAAICTIRLVKAGINAAGST
jgi:hypothetical protein